MNDQRVTGKFPTLERLALASLQEQFPDLKRKGFITAVRAILTDNGSQETPFTIIPDGWVLQPCGIFIAVEIEDRHHNTMGVGSDCRGGRR